MSDVSPTGGRPVPPTPALASLGRALASPKLGALLTSAAAAALGAGLILWTLQPEYVPLGEQGTRAEALEIIEALGAAGVEYRLDPATGLVLVPKEALARVRLDLAAAGLGERADIGFEALREDQALGTSHFTESARYRHALETELARTIAGLRNIESARMHLALPEPSVFVRDRGTASASVTIKARAGRTIEEEQVRAIVNLVASGVPHLAASDVTVVDRWGRLLSRDDDTASGGAAREHYDYARRLERLYGERIESLLTPILGPGRVRATVTAEVDFSSRERTEEAFEADPAKLRSEQAESRVSDVSLAGGVPGALSNQPPGDGFVEGEDPAGGAGEDGALDRSESTIRNFELDRSITHVRQTPGGVLRLSAAVIVDDRASLDENGEVVRTPLDAEELAEYTELVRQAIGFDAARGDTVTLSNRAFRPVEEPTPPEPLPLWRQDWVWTMVRQCLVGLAVLLLVLLVVRPAVRRLDLRAATLPADEDGEAKRRTDGALVGPDGTPLDDAGQGAPLAASPVVYGDILNMARALAAEDPKRVAKVVKDWVGESR